MCRFVPAQECESVCLVVGVHVHGAEREKNFTGYSEKQRCEAFILTVRQTYSSCGNRMFFKNIKLTLYKD